MNTTTVADVPNRFPANPGIDLPDLEIMKGSIMKNLDKVYQLEEHKRNEIIKDITSLLSAEDQILFAYLHGSFQEGLPFRDVDLAIFKIDSPPKQQLDYELRLEGIIEEKIKLPIDLKVLNNVPISFCYMVIKKGRKLFIRNDSKRVEFEVGTLKRYFDLLPSRQHYLKESINS